MVLVVDQTLLSAAYEQPKVLGNRVVCREPKRSVSSEQPTSSVKERLLE